MRNYIFALAYRLICVLERMFPARNAIPVIMYHRVADDGEPLTISTENFRTQMRILSEEGYEVVTLTELEQILHGERKKPKKAVALTFDDGYKDNLTNAKPIMDEHEFRGNVFVITGSIGETRAFSYGNPEGYPMLSVEEIQELERADWCMANHTHSHKKLTELTDEEITEEVSRARDVLSDILQNPDTAHYFATPKDRADERVIHALENAGIRMAFAGKGITRTSMLPRNLVRTEVPNTSARAEFLAFLSPWYFRLMPLYFGLKKIGLFRKKAAK